MTGASETILDRCKAMHTATHRALPFVANSANALVVLAKDEEMANEAYAERVLGNIGKPKNRKGARINCSASRARGQAYGLTLPLKQNLLR
jgi:hypothetical protein